MSRVKRGTIAHKRRKNLLKQAKGFKWGRKSKYRLAKQALMKAWSYAYRDRKTKKREFRKLWQIQINAASRQYDIPYSRLINQLKKKNVELDRKILATLANQEPKVFEKIVEKAKEE